jgi:peptide/nickel transport system substrate-binding protein
MTLFATSPVEPSVDQNPKTGGNNYNLNDQATGPYKIASYVPNKHIDLVRNTNWNPSTDPLRSALPDKVNITTSFNALQLDQSIEANKTDLDIGGTGVQAATQQKILTTPSLAARSLDPVTGFTRYWAIMQEVPPFNNVHCRMAVNYAMSRTEQIDARGGKYGGAVATTMGPPTLAGWKYYNAYPGTQSGSPNIAAAKEQLKLCGHPNGFHTTIVAQNQGKQPQQAAFLQQDLKAVGISTNIKTYNPSTYYSAIIGVPGNLKKNGYGLANAGWGPDWPAPYGYFENIVDPRKILPEGNSNYGACSDPAISTLIDAALKAPTDAQQYADWQKVDQTVIGKDSCDAPYDYDKALDLFSQRLSNVTIEPWLGIVDLRDLGVGG